MKIKKGITEIIFYLLMLNFFYEGIYKIAYWQQYGFWMIHEPILKQVGKVLQYIIPVGEILLALAFLTSRFRKAALYTTIIVEVIFIFWVVSVYLFTHYLFWPYHAIWSKPTWMQKMAFALGLSWLSFIAIILTSGKSRPKKDILTGMINKPTQFNA